MEGIMMKNKEQYAVAVRKPDGGIEVEVEHYHSVIYGSKLLDIPFVRGVFQFIDSLVLGMRCLNFSASFYEGRRRRRRIRRLTGFSRIRRRRSLMGS